MCNDVLYIMSLSFLGAWSWNWWYCVYCFLSSVQTVYSQADSQTADGTDHSHRLSIHPSTWLHVYKVWFFVRLQNLTTIILLCRRFFWDLPRLLAILYFLVKTLFWLLNCLPFSEKKDILFLRQDFIKNVILRQDLCKHTWVNGWW